MKLELKITKIRLGINLISIIDFLFSKFYLVFAPKRKKS